MRIVRPDICAAVRETTLVVVPYLQVLYLRILHAVKLYYIMHHLDPKIFPTDYLWWLSAARDTLLSAEIHYAKPFVVGALALFCCSQSSAFLNIFRVSFVTILLSAA